MDAGRVIYDNLPLKRRPLWAAKILRMVLPLISAPPELDALIEVANDQKRWYEAREIFNRIRQQTLNTQESLYYEVLNLAENVAKVIYNASAAPASYDYNAGWKIADSLKQITEQVADPIFEKEVLKVFCNQK